MLQGRGALIEERRKRLVGVAGGGGELGFVAGRIRHLHRRLLLVVEEGEHPVELLLRDRIELVVVALRAADGEAEPDRARRADAVDHAVDAELLDVDAAFLIEGRVAVEARGDALGFAGVGQEVARELFDREAVEGQVGVERVHHPVAIFPDAARGVDRVAIAVGVAGLV